MKNDDVHPPGNNEFEISLFGPGYGEAIAIHFGNGLWILVDSCIDPESGNPANLQYLRDLNVDISDSVKLVAATHWHDDHIRGISSVFRECRNAKFIVSGAFRTDELQELLGYFKGPNRSRNSGVEEFLTIFNILEENKAKGNKINSPTVAIADRILYGDDINIGGNKVHISVSSLSPSDSAIVQSNLGLLLPQPGEQRRRIVSPRPNQTSVVLWVEIGDHTILLGSDLENERDSTLGWNAIIDDSQIIAGRAGIIKVPHHGGESGHEPRVWDELLHPEPIAMISPFYLGNNYIPTSEDANRIGQITNEAFITSQPSKRKKYRADSRVVRDMLEGATKDIHEVFSSWGQIRVRGDIIGKTTPYETELFGEALRLRDYGVSIN